LQESGKSAAAIGATSNLGAEFRKIDGSPVLAIFENVRRRAGEVVLRGDSREERDAGMKVGEGRDPLDTPRP